MRPAFGIDLGTTNSCIAVIKTGEEPGIIRLRNGKTTMPSCVMWMGDDRFIVGSEAYEHRYQPNVAYSVKRKIGTDEKVVLEYQGIKRDFTPEEISSHVLTQLCEEAGDIFGKVEDVVITVPAYFDNNQCERTRKAGEMAGLNVLGIFREPTSASLLFNKNIQTMSEENVLVYDIGGGTSDISLVSMRATYSDDELDSIYGFEKKEDDTGVSIVVKAIAGDSHLGGDDIDKAIIDTVLTKLKENGLDMETVTKEDIEELKLRFEKYKKNMQYNIQAQLKGITADITSSDWYSAVKSVYDKTKVLLDSVLTEEERKNVKSIVLVGGTTKSDILRSMLEQDFRGVTISSALNPDESVALGASIQAKRLKFGMGRIQIFDALSLSIGVLAKDKVERILKRNHSVPYSETRVFKTSEDNQQQIDLHIFQGNSSIPEECVHLGMMSLTGFKPMPAGENSVAVTLSVNTEGVLKCHASIEGVEKEVELINLFRSAKQITIDDKKIIRWTRVANKLEERGKELLINKIEDYKNGKCKAMEVQSLVAELRGDSPTIGKRERNVK